MSRKDFILLAGIIKDVNVICDPKDQRLQRQLIAEDFARELFATNPRFNTELFIAAATGRVPLTARKAS